MRYRLITENFGWKFYEYRWIKSLVLSLAFLFISELLHAQEYREVLIRGDFRHLPQAGGHLQGIQSFHTNEKDYLVISGSSDLYSYYIMAEKQNDSLYDVKYVRELNKEPYGHAGGFQISENYLVIGIEDDERKDSSKVLIYDVSNPGSSDLYPMAIQLRGGTFKESTAGAVAASVCKDTLIVWVASWDAMSIDVYHFYLDTVHRKVLSQLHIEKWYPKEFIKNYPEYIWNAYQSIHLFQQRPQEFLLVGTGVSSNKQVVDFYSISMDTDRRWNWKPLKQVCAMYSEQSLRFGGGINIIGKNYWVYATPAHVSMHGLKIAYCVYK